MKTEINNTGKSIINGALVLTISTLLVKIFGLIYKVPLSYILSDEGMGYFNTAYSVYALFYVISTAGIPKAVSILTASTDDDEASKISIVAFRAFFTMGIIFSLIFIALSRPIAASLGNKSSYLSMISIAPSVAFVSASGALRGYFNGKLKLIPVAVSEVITGISKLVFGLVFAYYGERIGLEIYEIAAFSILGISLGSFLGFLYLYFLIKKGKEKHHKRLNIDVNSNIKIIRKILKISIPLTLTSAIGSLINLFDVALVMRMLLGNGFSELQSNIIYGNYTTLVVPMFNLVATLLAPISAVLLPILAKNSVNGNNSEFQSKTKLSLDIALFITAPIAFLFYGFADSILCFIFEDSSAKMAAPLLSSLSFAIIFMGILLVINTAIEGSGNYKIPLVSLTVGSIIKLIITGLLIPNDNFNITAAPIGTTISYLISFFISYFYLSCVKRAKIPILKNTFFAVIFSFLSLTAARLFDNLIKIEYRYLKDIFIYAIYAFVYLLLILIYIFIDKKTRKIYNSDKNNIYKLSI